MIRPLTIDNELRDELESRRRRFLELLVPLQTPEGVTRDPASDHERLRRILWVVTRELDTLLGGSRVPADLDLSKDDPATQQILYALVVRDYFSLHPLDDEGDVHIPLYTPEECGLRVFFEYGRWFVTWLKLEEDMSRPEALTREFLHFERDVNGQLVFAQV